MNLIEAIKSFISIEELEDESEQNPVEEIQEEAKDARKQKRIAVFEPQNYAEVTRIADGILDRNDAVINLRRLDKQSRRRLTDFLNGVTYQTGCEISFAGKEVLVCYWNRSEEG